MLNPATRRNNQRYKQEEFKTPITLWQKSAGDDTMNRHYKLTHPTHYRALIYQCSQKDRDILGTRFTANSLTIIVNQDNRNIPTTDQVIEISDERLGSGFYDVDEVIPDLTNGRNLKILGHKNMYADDQFEVFADGEV